MKKFMYTVSDGKKLFIRIPRDLGENDTLYLGVDKSLAGKTLCIESYDKHSKEIPFKSDVLEGSTPDSEMTYFGEEVKWKPQNVSYMIIEGHPDCRPGECGHVCQLNSCPVYQGYEEENIVEVSYVRSDFI